MITGDFLSMSLTTDNVQAVPDAQCVANWQIEDRRRRYREYPLVLLHRRAGVRHISDGTWNRCPEDHGPGSACVWQ